MTTASDDRRTITLAERQAAEAALQELNAYERGCLAGWNTAGVGPVFAKLHDLGLVTRTRDCDAWRFHFTDRGCDVRDILNRR